jgi:ketosteroid isomerase-like protein
MRHLALAVLVALCIGPAAQAQTSHPELMAPINKFIDSFNKGDAAGAAATHATSADLAIVDEVPPFVWHGADAFKAWAGDLEGDAKKKGITEPHVSISPATRAEVDGDNAYVIVPSVYSFKQGGASFRESAQMTFVLKKGANGWLIHGWTWTGPKPKKAAAAK